MLRSFDAAMMEYKGYLGTVHVAGNDLSCQMSVGR